MKVSQPTGSLCFPFVSIEYLHGPTGKKSKQTGVKKLFPPDLAIVNFIILKLLTLYILISIQQKNVRVCIVSHFDVSVLSISCLFNNNHLSVPFKMAYHFFVIFVLLSSTSRVVLFIKTTSQGRIFIFRLKRYVFYLCSLLYHHHFNDTLNSLTLIIMNCCCSCNLDGL